MSSFVSLSIRSSTQDPQSGQVEKSGGLGERSGVSVKSEVNLNDETLGTVTTERGEGQGEDPPAATATATPTGIFLQTTAYLLDLHALKFAEMSLAHGLTSLKDSHSTSHAYLMAEARLRIYRQQYEEAVTCIKQAIVVDIQVSTFMSAISHDRFKDVLLHTAIEQRELSRYLYTELFQYVNFSCGHFMAFCKLLDAFVKAQLLC